ncbi:MAG: hypothetical protein E7610_09145 [Ruminococcaceae bacterium]|nr:hypothetical protein [Oscillospiraceae bacterium]
MQSKINSLTIRTKTAVAAAVDNTRAEGFVDTGVKIIIAVVVGAVILGGLYALFNTVILPRLNTEIGEMFNYAG